MPRNDIPRVSSRRMVAIWTLIAAPGFVLIITAILLLLSGCASPTLETGAPTVPPRAAIIAAANTAVNGQPLADCNAYATAKQALLRELGIPSRLAVAITETNEGHLVDTVDDAGTTLVLDNRHPRPVVWWRLPYRWVSREDAVGLTWSAAK